MRKFWFQFAVEGPRNLTAVGAHYDSLKDALARVEEANQEREHDGRKPVVAIKRVYRNGRSELVCWVGQDDEEDE